MENESLLEAISKKDKKRIKEIEQQMKEGKTIRLI
jgi:hypothetical protein